MFLDGDFLTSSIRLFNLVWQNEIKVYQSNPLAKWNITFIKRNKTEKRQMNNNEIEMIN